MDLGLPPLLFGGGGFQDHLDGGSVLRNDTGGLGIIVALLQHGIVHFAQRKVTVLQLPTLFHFVQLLAGNIHYLAGDFAHGLAELLGLADKLIPTHPVHFVHKRQLLSVCSVSFKCPSGRAALRSSIVWKRLIYS